MALRDDARRWVKDQLANDQSIENPKAAIREFERVLPDLSADERQKAVHALKAQAEIYYQGRHNEATPAPVTANFKDIDQRIERLNKVDAAREVLDQYGGPITKRSIAEALERSAQERAQKMEVTKQVETPAREQTVQRSQEAPLRAHSVNLEQAAAPQQTRSIQQQSVAPETVRESSVTRTSQPPEMTKEAQQASLMERQAATVAQAPEKATTQRAVEQLSVHEKALLFDVKNSQAYAKQNDPAEHMQLTQIRNAIMSSDKSIQLDKPPASKEVTAILQQAENLGYKVTAPSNAQAVAVPAKEAPQQQYRSSAHYEQSQGLGY